MGKVQSTELDESSAPPKGTLEGFMHVAALMHAETIPPSERPALVRGIRSIKTRRQAYQFIDGVRTRLKAQQKK